LVLGKRYQEVLSATRHLRNRAGGPHFDFSVGPRVLTVRADDEIACARDVLRILLKKMLEEAQSDIDDLIQKGFDEGVLAEDLQAFFDLHDGRKAKRKSRTSN
jgi:hypothetical protein